MNIKLPPRHFRESIEERKFLESLIPKLYHTTESILTPNISGVGVISLSFHYHNIKLEVSEMEKILSLINPKTGIAMTPINTNYGFDVGFKIIYTFDKKSLLSFIERQLPEEYNFDKLSETFNRPDNLEMLESIGLESPKEHSYYVY